MVIVDPTLASELIVEACTSIHSKLGTATESLVRAPADGGSPPRRSAKQSADAQAAPQMTITGLARP